jgi:hypothetical protein
VIFCGGEAAGSAALKGLASLTPFGQGLSPIPAFPTAIINIAWKQQPGDIGTWDAGHRHLRDLNSKPVGFQDTFRQGRRASERAVIDRCFRLSVEFLKPKGVWKRITPVVCSVTGTGWFWAKPPPADE